ncbi:NXPE family member 3-like [Thunnus maccoyii]|uniref:NXPE family member 3-like n=1 Tax=Thunnus maccoyii TaxID=8240 RepID=UPI001C4D2E03|nr:NXPE family member 3-like [Thunnus maccoyii]XP_042259280.1 NXPE family member 3-like [Thunnus maccoyii]XP_042259281.1 NXPE family member 3-like [Thunnus maccoyii]XP_042259282.1 NXPE family member 3-like [Thunnus maccoyii]XP_042259283.1 NXPE family member 3-like [Thunnus maccoyii]XP_042259284.1 NXPE family member 3-like [Thunnus maccoyii]XP_042259285.1 NXPE family member 3-like [Thunnus maccoyii]XP_042259286.1 NXPE family member 3-like [Thunnus maccoyii]XP_042259287.1 NXPE family member 3
MKARACRETVVSFCCLKYGAIFLFLAVFVFIYFLFNMDFLEHKAITTFPAPRPHLQHRFCSFQPLSPEDALEERLLLDSIAWPETLSLPDPLSLEQTTDPAHSTFTILPEKGGRQWHVGDQLEAIIKMYDFKGRPKKSGGDVLLARLRNRALGAGVAGQVLDHLNGSYSAVFSLLWEGSAQVEVTLVHPSEAVMVLQRLTREQPDRVYFKSVFHSGSVSETTTCNVCLRPTQQPLCNYTDINTGEPWFCYKPKNLSCDARISHSTGGFNQNLKAKEEMLFKSGVNMKVSIKASGSANVNVLPKIKGQPEVMSSSVRSGPSGYYYQDMWQALGGTPVRQFSTSPAISQCLKGKAVHLYGDSTIRQWFEYLTAALPDLKEFNLHNLRHVGPFMALDHANNILVTYRCHGPPIRFVNVPTHDLRYIANEIDSLVGGINTVVVLGIWSHFSTFPIEVYIRRLQSIRRAVVRLLDRAPGTVVVIRTANFKALTLDMSLTNSDWYSLQRDKVLRAMFRGLNVRLLDAWEMALAHHLPHNLHPQPPIIKNMINVLLSYMCPQNGG